MQVDAASKILSHTITAQAPRAQVDAASNILSACLLGYQRLRRVDAASNILSTTILLIKEERFQAYAEYDIEFEDGGHLKFSALYAETSVPDWKTSPSYPPASNVLGNIVPSNHPGLIDLVGGVSAGNYNGGGASSDLANDLGTSALCAIPTGTADQFFWVPRPQTTQTSGCPATVAARDGVGKNAVSDALGGFYLTGAGADRKVVGTNRAAGTKLAIGTGTAAAPETAAAGAVSRNTDPALLFFGRFNGWGASAPATGVSRV